MNYEKAYKQALERVRELLSRCIDDRNRRTKVYRVEDIESIFPELAESEDERIRKELIEHIKANRGADFVLFQKFSEEEIISWLEKQGNQREQLINRACDVLVNCIENYMLSRMEVWSGECKNQTLENIRKKLEE